MAETMFFAADFTTGQLGEVLNVIKNLDLYISAEEGYKPRMIAINDEVDGQYTPEWIDPETYIPNPHKNHYVSIYYSGPAIKEMKCSDGEWRDVVLASVFAPFSLDLSTTFVTVVTDTDTKDGIRVYSHTVADGAITNEEVTNSGTDIPPDEVGLSSGYGI